MRERLWRTCPMACMGHRRAEKSSRGHHDTVYTLPSSRKTMFFLAPRKIKRHFRAEEHSCSRGKNGEAAG
jgi:hypothetical protein